MDLLDIAGDDVISGDCRRERQIASALQRQTAITAHFSSEQLLQFAFAHQTCTMAIAEGLHGETDKGKCQPSVHLDCRQLHLPCIGTMLFY